MKANVAMKYVNNVAANVNVSMSAMVAIYQLIWLMK